MWEEEHKGRTIVSVETSDKKCSLKFFCTADCMRCLIWMYLGVLRVSSPLLLRSNWRWAFTYPVGSRSTFTLLAQVSSGFPAHLFRRRPTLSHSGAETALGALILTWWACVFNSKTKEKYCIHAACEVEEESMSSLHCLSVVVRRSNRACVHGDLLMMQFSYPAFRLVVHLNESLRRPTTHGTQTYERRRIGVIAELHDFPTKTFFRLCLTSFITWMKNVKISSETTGFGQTWCCVAGKWTCQLIAVSSELKIVEKLSIINKYCEPI